MAVVQAVPVIALGHAVSILAVASAIVLVGVLIDQQAVKFGAAAALLAWAGWHQLYGHRRRVRIGLTTGLAGLALWSFLMATAHGAGLMILPALMPLCLTASPIGAIGGSGSAAMTLAAVGVHSAAMLAVTTLMAVVVYRFVGLEVLRSAWINVDVIWTLMLVATAAILLLSG
jgi:hypothetical protein